MASPYDFGLDFQRTQRVPIPEVFGTPTTVEPPPVAAPVVPYAPPPEPVPTPVAAPPAVTQPAAFSGSPLDTLYGVDTESYLTEDQRKLARMIQGKFDASMNRRDRELQRYGSPRLASFTEDEALARAMALARGLNYKTPDVLGAGGVNAPRGVGSGGGGGGGGSLRPGGSSGTSLRGSPSSLATKPAAAAKPPAGTNWQQIMSGLSSLAPLLFGKDAMGNLMNKGLLGVIKEQLFGPAGTMIDDRVLEQMVTTGQFPDAGGFQVNPFTGMPMAPEPYATGTYPDVYGPGSGWGEEAVMTTPPMFPDPADPYGIGGWDGGWGAGGGGGWDGWDSGFWYPEDVGSYWDMADPFAIGGW